MVSCKPVVMALFVGMYGIALEAMQDQKHEFKNVIIPRLKTRRSGSLILQQSGQETPRSPRVINTPGRSDNHPSSAPVTTRDEERSHQPLVKDPQSARSKMIDTLGLSPRTNADRQQPGYRSPLSTRGRSTSSHERDMYSGSEDEGSDLYRNDDIFKDYHAVDVQKLSDDIQKIISAKKYYQDRIAQLDKKMATLVQKFANK